MRIRLDPWSVETHNSQLTLGVFKGTVFDVETEDWQAIAPKPIPETWQEVFVIDGKPRLEARLLFDSEELTVGALATSAVGAVSLCPHGSRPARISHIELNRLLLHSHLESVDSLTLTASASHLAELNYQPLSFNATQSDPSAALQAYMLKSEAALGKRLAAALPLDAPEPDEDADEKSSTAENVPQTLVIQDGPIRVNEKGWAILGCVKTFQADYLGKERHKMLETMQVGERTPIFRFTIGDTGTHTGDSEQQRFSWYVRLATAEMHPLAGLLRLEMHAPEDYDFVPKAVQEIADFSGSLLTRLGSLAHKDKRAPQNLIPTAALERELARRMGDLGLIQRRIRSTLIKAALVTEDI